jgi:hypothetical protein
MIMRHHNANLAARRKVEGEAWLLAEKIPRSRRRSAGQLGSDAYAEQSRAATPSDPEK